MARKLLVAGMTLALLLAASAAHVATAAPPSAAPRVDARSLPLVRMIDERFQSFQVGVELAERSVGDVLRRLGFRRLVARPRHPGHDAVAQASFGTTSPPS